MINKLAMRVKVDPALAGLMLLIVGVPILGIALASGQAAHERAMAGRTKGRFASTPGPCGNATNRQLIVDFSPSWAGLLVADTL